jgi:hypothetical protein
MSRLQEKYKKKNLFFIVLPFGFIITRLATNRNDKLLTPTLHVYNL